MNFRDRLGVNVHMTYPWYLAAIPQVQEMLDWLGVTHIRDRGTVGCTKLTGKHVNVICYTAADARAAVTAGATTIEGPNEPNGAPGWETTTRTALTAIRSGIAHRVPLLAPAINQTQPYDTLGQVDADYGNVHVYRNGADMVTYQARINRAMTTEAAVITPFRPVICTETGWHDDSGPRSTTRGDVATQFLETVTALWMSGARRVYLYELFDETKQGPGPEACFGLFTADFQPKPLAYAVRDFLATYGDDDDLAALKLRPKMQAALSALA